jgi:hypothetical protein
MSENNIDGINSLVRTFLDQLMRNYWGPLWRFIDEHRELCERVTGFLVDHEKVIIYVGRTHIGVEYIGSEILREFRSERLLHVEYHDHSTQDCSLLEKIIGFPYDSTVGAVLPLSPVNQDLILPTNRGVDKMHELGWNYAAQDSIIGLNVPTPEAPRGQFTRIINSFFFDANQSGLVTRHIKWLDLIPAHFDGSDELIDSFGFTLEPMKKLVEPDARFIYPLPSDYKFKKLPKINRFIELWSAPETSEPDITSFLADDENRFILTMRFGAKECYRELECYWQSETKPRIRPDFFLLQPNGFADIVEFKLPRLSGKAIVGSDNRETFAAFLSSYVAQTRVYSSYFDDPNNRTWFEQTYGFKVRKPKRWLVVGRRSDFDSDVWRDIVHDYRDLEIITYDDLVDGVVAQFYR